MEERGVICIDESTKISEQLIHFYDSMYNAVKQLYIILYFIF